jgi:ADP-ribosylglycohydrolase
MDQLQGGLLGLALGDALGAPHEFRYSISLNEYTGKLIHPIYWKSRFGPMQQSAIGQITDDTSMSIALLKSLLQNSTWNYTSAVSAYINWANSGLKFLGRNTRKLFKGIKTIKGYQNRYQRFDLSDAQSNGSLMRAYPLIFLFYWHSPEEAYQLAMDDTNLTNPTAINRDATLVYLEMIRLIIANTQVKDGLTKLLNSAQTKPIRNALEEAMNGQTRNAKYQKGWVAHPIFFQLKHGFKPQLEEVFQKLSIGL